MNNSFIIIVHRVCGEPYAVGPFTAEVAEQWLTDNRLAVSMSAIELRTWFEVMPLIG